MNDKTAPARPVAIAPAPSPWQGLSLVVNAAGRTFHIVLEANANQAAFAERAGDDLNQAREAFLGPRMQQAAAAFMATDPDAKEYTRLMNASEALRTKVTDAQALAARYGREATAALTGVESAVNAAASDTPFAGVEQAVQAEQVAKLTSNRLAAMAHELNVRLKDLAPRVRAKQLQALYEALGKVQRDCRAELEGRLREALASLFADPTKVALLSSLSYHYLSPLAASWVTVPDPNCPMPAPRVMPPDLPANLPGEPARPPYYAGIR